MSRKRIKPCSSWTQEDMNKALEAVRIRGVSIRTAARDYRIPSSTLHDRLKGKVKDTCTIGGSTKLSPEQEQTLLKYVEYMALRGMPLTVPQILMYAWYIDKASGSKVFKDTGPCYGWWNSFKNRHSECLKLQKTHLLHRSRVMYSTVDNLRSYFQLLKNVLQTEELNKRPEDIYNCDETIINLNKSSSKIVIPHRMKTAHTRQVAGTEHITLHCCVSAAGYALPPMIVFKGAFPDGNYTRGGPDGCLYEKQDSGFMDSELFLKWFKNIFLHYSKPTPQRSVLLLLDGHASHCSPQVIDCAKENNVILFALAPHTTHICQPLDVAVYKTLESHLSKAIKLGMALRGNLWVSRNKVPMVIKEPFESSMTKSNIKSGFKKCGIVPFNPNSIDKWLLKKNKLIPDVNVDLSIPPPNEQGSVLTQIEEITCDQPDQNTVPVADHSNLPIYQTEPLPSVSGKKRTQVSSHPVVQAIQHQMSRKRIKLCSSWTQEDMNKALEAVRIRGVSIRTAARDYRIPPATLHDRLKGKVKDTCTMGGRTKLSPEQEQTLLNYMEYMALRGMPLTVPQILMYAWYIDKTSGSKVFKDTGPCYGWWNSFKNRHSECLKLRKIHLLHRSRVMYSTVDNLRSYFQLLKNVLQTEELNKRPEDIYNCDETIINLDKNSSKVVIPHRMKTVYTRKVVGTEHITLHCCVSAAGYALPPMIVFKGAFPDGNYTRGGPDGCLYEKQDSGFMDSELFLKWFKNIFLHYSKPTPQRSVLLLLDGHASHCSPQVIDCAKENNVILFALAPHTTHICQPLDVAVYKTLESHLSKAIKLGMALRGNLWVSRNKIPMVIKEPFESSMTKSNIKSGFKKCGIVPFNPNSIDKWLLKKNKLIPDVNVDLSIPPPNEQGSVSTQIEEITCDQPDQNTVPVADHSNLPIYQIEPLPSVSGKKRTQVSSHPVVQTIQHQTNKLKQEQIDEDSVSEPDYYDNFDEKLVAVKGELDEFSDGQVIINEEIEDSLDDEDFSDNESGSMAHRNWQDWSKITEDLSDDSDSDSSSRQCTGCLSTFEKLVFDLQKSDEKALEVFASHGIIPRVRTCPRCANLCVFKLSERLFYCDQKVTIPGSVGEYMCSYSVSQDHDTWLFHFKHNPNIVLRFINLFLQSFFSFKYCAVNYKLSKDTFEKWQRLCLEVCTHWLNNQEPIGGPGIQVEIGDSKFTRSHCDEKDAVVWIFGGIERRSQKKFVVEVQTQTRESLIPLIQKYVKPQTVVFSDSQEPYASISELPQNYTHIKTNPSIKSSDSVDRNIHTKNIGNLLNSIKAYILKSGCKEYNFRQFFQRFMFLASHPNDQTILHDFLIAIAAMYLPPKQV